MNYVKIETDKLVRIFSDDIDYQSLVEQLVLDELTIFYVYESDVLVGVLDRNDVIEHRLPSLQKDYSMLLQSIQELVIAVQTENEDKEKKLRKGVKRKNVKNVKHSA